MPKSNNFDLVRLVAALQVAFSHAWTDIGPADYRPYLQSVIELFPGVPIFFFISGFLISRSFESNPRLREYALNRFLRIYPGLAVCFAASLVSVWATGYFATASIPLGTFVTWVAAQLSVAQFYNPDFMRHYGLGVLNGSMWTLSVEIQFYFLIPLLYGSLRPRASRPQRTNLLLVLLIGAFLVLNQVYAHAVTVPGHQPSPWLKVAGVSFVPWFYMFLVGVLFQKNFDAIQGWLAGRFLIVLTCYSAVGLLGVHLLGWRIGNLLNPVLFGALAVLTFSAAFSAGTLSDRILRRNDLSYGVYIYHAPVINLLLALGVAAGFSSVATVVAASMVAAYLSWILVERPALGLKRHPLYKHVRTSSSG